MHTLLLMRHARAQAASNGMPDPKRRLDQVGRAEAQAMGAMMAERRIEPGVVICSSAVRTRETLDCLEKHIEIGRTLFSDDLYSANPAGYLRLVRAQVDCSSLLLIGHNPTVEELLSTLPGEGQTVWPAGRKAGFPTAGLAIVTFETSFDRIAPGEGCLKAFLAPPR